MIRTFRFMLLLFALLGIFGEGFHHHDDLQEHPDCPVCVVGNAPVLTPDVPSATIYFAVEIAFLVIPEETSFPEYYRASQQARAPPSFS